MTLSENWTPEQVRGDVWGGAGLTALTVMPDLFRHPTCRRRLRMRDIEPCVYIMASGRLGTLYVGVTSNLVARVMQHRDGTFGGFTKAHRVHRLVWFETGASMEGAIAREKAIKKWRRAWKCNLIERANPEWNDLAVGLGLERLT